MSETKNAVVTRRHTNGARTYLKGAVIAHMPAGHFADLELIGVVREADEADLQPEAEAPAADAGTAPAKASKAKAASAA
jgi:hypothetical protein